MHNSFLNQSLFLTLFLLSSSLVTALNSSVCHPLITVPQRCPCPSTGCSRSIFSSFHECSAVMTPTISLSFCLFCFFSPKVSPHSPPHMSLFCASPCVSSHISFLCLLTCAPTCVVLHLLLCLFRGVLWCLLPR